MIYSYILTHQTAVSAVFTIMRNYFSHTKAYKIELSLSFLTVGKIESIIGVPWGQKNPNPEGPPFQWETRLAELPRFPLNGGPECWDFSGDH